MIVNFDILPETSRLWIYASETKFNKDQQIIIKKDITIFLDNWKHHNKKILSSFKIIENQFLIIAVDESQNKLGGCSLDSLQRLIQELERKIDTLLLNRLNVFCRVGDLIKCYSSLELNKYVNRDTFFYDLTIQKKGDLSNWIKPIRDGWCSKFFISKEESK